MGPLARAAAAAGAGPTQVIVRAPDASALAELLPAIPRAGGSLGRQLPIINGVVVTIAGAALDALSQHPLVDQISVDRPVRATMERTGTTVGAAAVRDQFGYDGSGVGVAVIDSGITSWHDDLGGPGTQRVAAFVDFVNQRSTPYDDFGHGSHVAGIVAGNGFDSAGRRSGIAPEAQLVILKTLDASGAGRISDVIAALDYVRVNRRRWNIRIVNMSVGAGVFESYDTDPLTLATKRLVAEGVVVVAAAGNAGKDTQERTRYAGITAPGNAPWVLTVGASSHMGTAGRADDTIAAFSSRGPTPVNHLAKPDLVAPGVGIESLSDPISAFYSSKSAFLLAGTVATGYLPYLSLNGTSMAAPVVAGTVALMLEANPALTPNAVKAILQYTSQTYYGYDALTQGAGFLNAAGAVQLARHFADPGASAYPSDASWSGHFIWANRLVSGGQLTPSWAKNVTWGDQRTATGEAVTWGNGWTLALSPNVVWGIRCGGSDCQGTWKTSTAGAALLGTDDDDTIVWGNNADTLVWGNSDADTIVWGNGDDDTIVWGNSCLHSSCEPVIWNPTTP
jgi:serine protease AprX